MNMHSEHYPIGHGGDAGKDKHYSHPDSHEPPPGCPPPPCGPGGGHGGGHGGGNDGGNDGGVGGPVLPPINLPGKGRDDYGTYLLIRYTNDLDSQGAFVDRGGRPLPGGTVFWESPNIWVESSLGVNQPVVGEANAVFANVTNLGWQPAVGVNVEFWWANPALAITEATATHFGTAFVEQIPPGWTVTVPSPKPWIPVAVNGGHECLVAQAYIKQQDDLSQTLDPVDDRHVGQKNEQVVQLSAGQAMTWRFAAANVLGLAQNLTFEVFPLRLNVLPQALALRTRHLRAAVQPPAAVLPVNLRVGTAPAVFTGPSTFFAARLLSMVRQAVAGQAVTEKVFPVQASLTHPFQPWESREIEITGQVPAGAMPGQTFAFRVVQRLGRSIAGGYTVYVVVV